MAINGIESRMQEAAHRMARACRHIVQACLREEEWRDADEEFERVILLGLQELEVSDARQPNDATRP